MALSFGGLFVLLFVYLAVIVGSIVATARIISKAGYSGLWVLVSFVPFLNMIMFFVFAFSKWPIEARLEQARRQGWYGPGTGPGGPYGGGPYGGGPAAPPGAPYGGAPTANYAGSVRQAPTARPPAPPSATLPAPTRAPAGAALQAQPGMQPQVEPLPVAAQPVRDVEEVEIPPFRL